MLDYNLRPSLPSNKLADVTNTLASWLPSQEMSGDLAGWTIAEWEAAEWVVYWQNALPWLVARLGEAQIEPPEPVNSRLRAINVASRERTARMLDACTEIVDAFRQAGIQTVLLKGAALAPLYYADPLLRPLADLDLLIQPKDLAASRDVMLKQLGFRYYSRSAEDDVYLRGERKKNIWAADNVHPVEVHFALREEYAGIGYEMAEMMWQASAERPYWQNATARIPSPPALLLHVCAHATSDWLIQRGRLMHIDDIRKLCARMGPEEWHTFDRMVQPHTARFIYPAVTFMSKYTRLDIPDTTILSLREASPPALRSWLGQAELADASESNPTIRSGIGLEIARRLARSRMDMARFWLRSIFPRRYNLAKRYPRLVETPLWPIAYALINMDRLWHLFKKWSAQ